MIRSKTAAVLLSFLFVQQISAHDSNKAYFDYYLNEDVYVVAELPWTLRSSVILFDSAALSSNQEEFDRITNEYFKKNLKLSTNETQLDLLSIEELKTGHSGHAITFKLDYEDGVVIEVCNTILTNLDSTQINYNTVHVSDADIHEETTFTRECFDVQHITSKKWLFLLLILLVFLLFWVLFKKIKK